MEGWRQSTVDVDLRIEPDSDALLRRLAELKDELDLNIELASPPDFVPELSGWRERSPFAFQSGLIGLAVATEQERTLSRSVVDA